MSISNYNQSCGYRIGKLEDAIYIISKDAVKGITIDNGEAYISAITTTPTVVKAYSVTLEDSETLDERYKFTHTIRFSVKGYSNQNLFDGNYYIAVKNTNGTYWMVNPILPCKVTYTYTLDGSDEHTDFTLSTVSNFPTLRMNYNGNLAIPTDCGYKHCVFKSLKINENDYVRLAENNQIIYTNDGFKDVHFLKNTASFQETFDGKALQHSLSFKIGFDDYKSSWHYNLLEFTENKYTAIIQATNGKYILGGFAMGLQPSYSVTASDSMDFDSITITFQDKFDDGVNIPYLDDIALTQNTQTTWVWSTKFNGYECIGDNTARYLLKEEQDSFSVPTGRYQCLVGYTSYFTSQGVNIIGTFSNTTTFAKYGCVDGCSLQTSFPPSLVFNAVTCYTISILCNSNWSLSSSNNRITVSPSSGVAGQSYSVQVCNRATPTVSAQTSNLTLTYCGGRTKTYDVTVIKGDDCFPQGTTYNVNAAGQYLTIPTTCCVSNVVDFDDIIHYIEIQNTYVKVYIPENTETSGREINLHFTMCDEIGKTVTINQSRAFESWVNEGTVCNGMYECTVERRYTGVTSDEITGATNETRTTNCHESINCSIEYRWKYMWTICIDGSKYGEYIKQYSMDGSTWYNVIPNEYDVQLIEENSSYCSYCTVQTTLPSTLEFCNTTTAQFYQLLCDTDWTAEASEDWIILSTTSGTSGTSYSFKVTNTKTPVQNQEFLGTITIHACDRDTVYNVRVAPTDSCARTPLVNYAPASGGSMTWALADCTIIDAYEETNTLNISIVGSGKWLRFTDIPANTADTTITYYIHVTFSDYISIRVRLIQSGVFARYEPSYYGLCMGDRSCTTDRKYTGYTITNITNPTVLYRYNNCLLDGSCNT